MYFGSDFIEDMLLIQIECEMLLFPGFSSCYPLDIPTSCFEQRIHIADRGIGNSVFLLSLLGLALESKQTVFVWSVDDDLFDIIPISERPQIEYNPRMTKIPRLTRQLGLQTLTGRFLAFLLEVQGISPLKALQVLHDKSTN